MQPSEKNILLTIVLALAAILGGLIYQKVYLPSLEEKLPPGTGDIHDEWTEEPFEFPPPDDLQEEPQAANPFSGKLGNAIDQARKESKDVLVFLSSENCSWCTQMKQTTLADPKVREALGEYVFVELLYSEDPDFAKSMGIRGFPSYVVLDKNGKVLNKWEGYMKSDEFISALDGDQKKGLFDKILRR